MFWISQREKSILRHVFSNQDNYSTIHLKHCYIFCNKYNNNNNKKLKITNKYKYKKKKKKEILQVNYIINNIINKKESWDNTSGKKTYFKMLTSKFRYRMYRMYLNFDINVLKHVFLLHISSKMFTKSFKP